MSCASCSGGAARLLPWCWPHATRAAGRPCARRSRRPAARWPTQATAVEASQVVAQLRQWLLARQFAAVQQPGQALLCKPSSGRLPSFFALGRLTGPSAARAGHGRGSGRRRRAAAVRRTPPGGRVRGCPPVRRCPGPAAAGHRHRDNGHCPGSCRAACRPRERAEHQRVFQPLAGVDGDDLHPFGIAFQAQQRLLTGAFAAALGIEPGEQRLQPGRSRLSACSNSPRCKRLVSRRSPSTRVNSRSATACSSSQARNTRMKPCCCQSW